MRNPLLHDVFSFTPSTTRPERMSALEKRHFRWAGLDRNGMYIASRLKTSQTLEGPPSRAPGGPDVATGAGVQRRWLHMLYSACCPVRGCGLRKDALQMEVHLSCNLV
jgi:hypothetical protein